jgi:glycopeptide antibiotics resistance protein
MCTPVSPQPAALLLPKLLLLSWVIVIVLGTTLPWHTIHPALQWWRIDWSPFPSGALGPRVLFDVALNVVLYLPFGYLVRQWVEQKSGRMMFVYVIGMGAGLSCCTEFVQIFNPVRFPAMADVIINVTGALLGAWAVVPKDYLQPSFLLVDTISESYDNHHPQ